ncbi:unnamed protein product, partial [Symbiodinium microadriaticum]
MPPQQKGGSPQMPEEPTSTGSKSSPPNKRGTPAKRGATERDVEGTAGGPANTTTRRPTQLEKGSRLLEQQEALQVVGREEGGEVEGINSFSEGTVADSLFNQAFCTLMTIGTLSGGSHVQAAVDALIDNPLGACELWGACKVRWHEKLGIPAKPVATILGNKLLVLPGETGEEAQAHPEPSTGSRAGEPLLTTAGGAKAKAVQKIAEGEEPPTVKEEVDWDNREAEAVVTPPYLGDNEDSDKPWQDLEDHKGDHAPVTPDLLLDVDEDTEGGTTTNVVEENLRDQWPSQAAFATIFQNTTMAELRREWGMPESSSTPRRSPRSPSRDGEAKAAGDGGGQALDQDELVTQVMEELRAQGSAAKSSGGSKPEDVEEEVDIEIDTNTRIRPARLPNRASGAILWAQSEAENGRGEETYPQSWGTHREAPAREDRRKCSGDFDRQDPQGLKPMETLSAKMKRIAVFMDREGDGAPSAGGQKKRRHENVLVLCLSSASSSAAWVWNDEDLQDSNALHSGGLGELENLRNGLMLLFHLRLGHVDKGRRCHSILWLCPGSAPRVDAGALRSLTKVQQLQEDPIVADRMDTGHAGSPGSAVLLFVHTELKIPFSCGGHEVIDSVEKALDSRWRSCLKRLKLLQDNK